MKRQETLLKRYGFIVDKARSVNGLTLDDYYNNCSRAKRYAYQDCIARIPAGAINLHHGVGSANSFQFTFYADFEVTDTYGNHWQIARYESASKIETIGYFVEERKFYELSAHEIIGW